jgi:hypothetical protein
MATRTLGTNANNTLTAFVLLTGAPSVSGLAAFNAAVKDDLIVAHPIEQTCLNLNGDLEVPNRIDTIYTRQGDAVAVDPNGWPIYLSAKALASGPWTQAGSTLGTNATTSLTAIRFGQDVSDADFATIASLIKDDLINGSPVYPGAFSQTGQLFLPNRGYIQVLPGDYVAVDSTGWPIVISANSIAGSGWTHT